MPILTTVIIPEIHCYYQEQSGWLLATSCKYFPGFIVSFQVLLFCLRVLLRQVDQAAVCLQEGALCEQQTCEKNGKGLCCGECRHYFILRATETAGQKGTGKSARVSLCTAAVCRYRVDSVHCHRGIYGRASSGSSVLPHRISPLQSIQG